MIESTKEILMFMLFIALLLSIASILGIASEVFKEDTCDQLKRVSEELYRIGSGLKLDVREYAEAIGGSCGG